MNQITRELSSNPRREFATNNGDQVTALINASGIDPSLLAKLPVNVNEIARSLGAKVIRQVDLPVDGLMLPIADGFEILLNKRHSVNRQRFSCAHEIAHALIDPGKPACRGIGTRSNSGERSCENLASILLMPDPAFTNYLNAYGPSIGTVAKLSNVFRTSIQATAIRMTDVLGRLRERCILLVSDRIEQDGQEMRLKWFYQNTLTPDGHLRYLFPRNKSLNLRTARVAYETDQLQEGSEQLSIGNLTVAATTESKAFGHGPYRFVLTLLFPS